MILGTALLVKRAYGFAGRQTAKNYRKWRGVVKRNAYTYGYKRGLKRRYKRA